MCPQIIVHVGQKGHGDSVLRGVIKPFSRIPTQDPYEAYAFTTTVACAKFGEFSSMFSPSEIEENNSLSTGSSHGSCLGPNKKPVIAAGFCIIAALFAGRPAHTA